MSQFEVRHCPECQCQRACLEQNGWDPLPELMPVHGDNKRDYQRHLEQDEKLEKVDSSAFIGKMTLPARSNAESRDPKCDERQNARRESSHAAYGFAAHLVLHNGNLRNGLYPLQMRRRAARSLRSFAIKIMNLLKPCIERRLSRIRPEPMPILMSHP